jgi:hypothetical protein
MKKFIQNTVVMAALVATGGAAAAAGRTTVATVAMLQVWSTGAGTVRMRLNSGGAKLCDTPAGGAQWSDLGELAVGVGGVTADGAKAMLATLTAAKLAGKSVTLYTNDGAPGGLGCAIFAVELN